MKKVLIGGFVALIGSIWALAVIFLAGNDLVSGWTTPPGRFLTAVIQMDLLPVFIFAVILVLAGLVILAAELFRKEK